MKKRKLRARVKQLERDYDALYIRFMEREEPTVGEKVMYGARQSQSHTTPILDLISGKVPSGMMTWGWSNSTNTTKVEGA